MDPVAVLDEPDGFKRAIRLVSLEIVREWQAEADEKNRQKR